MFRAPLSALNSESRVLNSIFVLSVALALSACATTTTFEPLPDPQSSWNRTGYERARLSVVALVVESGGEGDAFGAGIVYDDRGLLLASDGPIGTIYGYDDGGRLTSREDTAGTWAFSYTDANELDVIADPQTGLAIDHDWLDGQLTSIDYGSTVGTRTYTYDDAGRLATDTWSSSAGLVWAVGYGYDGNSNVTSRSVTAPGNAGAGAWSYQYDTANRLVAWTHAGTARSVVWDGNGNRESHGGVSFGFDDRNRLISSP